MSVNKCTVEEEFEEHYASTLPPHLLAHHKKYNHEGMAGYDKSKAAYLAGRASGYAVGRSDERKRCSEIANSFIYNIPQFKESISDIVHDTVCEEIAEAIEEGI